MRFGSQTYALGFHDPSEQHPHLQGSILMKNPIESIVVVAYRCDPGKHQFTGTPGIVAIVVAIKVLPQQTTIFLVKSDSAGDDKRSAGLVRKGCVEKGGIRRRVRLGLK